MPYSFLHLLFPGPTSQMLYTHWQLISGVERTLFPSNNCHLTRRFNSLGFLRYSKPMRQEKTVRLNIYPGSQDMRDEKVKLDTKNTKFQLIVIAYLGLQILWLQKKVRLVFCFIILNSNDWSVWPS